MRRVELERHAAHGDHGHLPAGKLVERLEKVLRGPPPPGQLGDQNSVDPASLCELEDAVAHEPVVPGSRCGFLEDAEHLEAAALGEGGELGNPSASRNASAAGQTAVMACSSTPASPRSASTRTALPNARITARALMPELPDDGKLQQRRLDVRFYTNPTPALTGHSIVLQTRSMPAPTLAPWNTVSVTRR